MGPAEELKVLMGDKREIHISEKDGMTIAEFSPPFKTVKTHKHALTLLSAYLITQGITGKIEKRAGKC